MAIRDAHKRASKAVTGVAAVGMAASLVGVAATQSDSISASLVDLTSLIVVGSSTNPGGSGVEDFFQSKFKDPAYTGPAGDDITVVNFLTGLLGIQGALDTSTGAANAVLASGWGAANASLLLFGDAPELARTVFILDNDVARPDGGFGTRYPWFALIGVNPLPTPADTEAQAVVNIGYQYDYNSNAPADVLNPIAAVNSLVAYLYTRLNQSDIELPVDVDGTPLVTCGANTCAVTVSGAVLDCPDARCSSPDDRIAVYLTTRGNTTYLTYTTEELPLTRLIRDIFGDRIADITAPLLHLAVDSAYYDGNPIPKDPSVYRPARLFPSPADVLATLAKVPAAIQESLAAATSPSGSRHASTTVAPSEQMTEDDVKDDFTEDIAKPLRNVVRESLKAIPGKVSTAGTSTGAKEAQPEEISKVTQETESIDDDSEVAESPTAPGTPTSPGAATDNDDAAA